MDSKSIVVVAAVALTAAASVRAVVITTSKRKRETRKLNTPSASGLPGQRRIRRRKNVREPRGPQAQVLNHLARRHKLGRRRYLISVSSLNIGRYIEITIVPTIAPTPIISTGSMIEVSDWMLESTSSS